MCVPGEGRIETAHQFGVAEPQFRCFAKPLARGETVDRKTTASFAQDDVMVRELVL